MRPDAAGREDEGESVGDVEGEETKAAHCYFKRGSIVDIARNKVR